MARAPGRTIALALASVAIIAVACTSTTTSTSTTASPVSTNDAHGMQKLDHLIFIVQENRSFDHYFGTYPGADGLPTNPDGSFAVCIPNKFQGGACVSSS